MVYGLILIMVNLDLLWDFMTDIGNDDFNWDNIAIDIAASLMIIPGLEARLGMRKNKLMIKWISDNISQFNGWIAYNQVILLLHLSLII